MIIALLGAGIGVVVAGLLAIGFGIPVKEFSLGNTLILAGTVAVCTGLIMVSLSMVIRELRAIARRLGAANQAVAPRARSEPPPTAFTRPESDGELPADGPLFLRDQPTLENPGAADSATPWQEEVTRDRTRQRGNVPAAAESEPEAKPRRNLLFSTSSRKERERAAGRGPDPVANHPNSAAPAAATAPFPSPEAGPPTTFEDAWPASEPTRSDPYRRSARTPSTFNDAHAGAAGTDDRSQVTVLKSGVVDGMAYSLYSDGSIEAQMPEGMMRFASIGELRAHLDQRP
jgi:hypothetical protein